MSLEQARAEQDGAEDREDPPAPRGRGHRCEPVRARSTLSVTPWHSSPASSASPITPGRVPAVVPPAGTTRFEAGRGAAGEDDVVGLARPAGVEVAVRDAGEGDRVRVGVGHAEPTAPAGPPG